MDLRRGAGKVLTGKRCVIYFIDNLFSCQNTHFLTFILKVITARDFWINQRARCAEFGGDLVSIHSNDSNYATVGECFEFYLLEAK